MEKVPADEIRKLCGINLQPALHSRSIWEDKLKHIRRREIVAPGNEIEILYYSADSLDQAVLESCPVADNDDAAPALDESLVSERPQRPVEASP